MAATFAVKESNGAGEVVTTATNINFGSTDSANLTPAEYPVTAGENSYEKWIRLHFSGTFNKISNIRIWKSAGDYIVGEAIKTNLKTSDYSEATYATPTANTSSVATETMPTAEPTKNLGIDGSLTGELSSEGYTDYWIMQAQISASAVAGDGNQKTITMKYDEM